jgi:hypothetical protein
MPARKPIINSRLRNIESRKGRPIGMSARRFAAARTFIGCRMMMVIWGLPLSNHSLQNAKLWRYAYISDVVPADIP